LKTKAKSQIELANAGEASLDEFFDLAIMGEASMGCGIARDAAGRGNSVFL